MSPRTSRLSLVREVSYLFSIGSVLFDGLLLVSCGETAGDSPSSQKNELDPMKIKKHYEPVQGPYQLSREVRLDDPSSDEKRSDLVLKDGVYKLPTEIASDVRTTKETVTFQRNKQNEYLLERKEGDIVISRDNRDFNWRRIEDVTVTEEQIQWKTETPGLTEVIGKGDFHLRARMNPHNYAEMPKNIELAKPYFDDPANRAAKARRQKGDSFPMSVRRQKQGPTGFAKLETTKVCAKCLTKDDADGDGQNECLTPYSPQNHKQALDYYCDYLEGREFNHIGFHNGKKSASQCHQTGGTNRTDHDFNGDDSTDKMAGDLFLIASGYKPDYENFRCQLTRVTPVITEAQATTGADTDFYCDDLGEDELAGASSWGKYKISKDTCDWAGFTACTPTGAIGFCASEFCEPTPKHHNQCSGQGWDFTCDFRRFYQQANNERPGLDQARQDLSNFCTRNGDWRLCNGDNPGVADWKLSAAYDIWRDEANSSEGSLVLNDVLTGIFSGGIGMVIESQMQCGFPYRSVWDKFEMQWERVIGGHHQIGPWKRMLEWASAQMCLPTIADMETDNICGYFGSRLETNVYYEGEIPSGFPSDEMFSYFTDGEITKIKSRGDGGWGNLVGQDESNTDFLQPPPYVTCYREAQDRPCGQFEPPFTEPTKINSEQGAVNVAGYVHPNATVGNEGAERFGTRPEEIRCLDYQNPSDDYKSMNTGTTDLVHSIKSGAIEPGGRVLANVSAADLGMCVPDPTRKSLEGDEKSIDKMGNSCWYNKIKYGMLRHLGGRPKISGKNYWAKR